VPTVREPSGLAMSSRHPGRHCRRAPRLGRPAGRSGTGHLCRGVSGRLLRYPRCRRPESAPRR
jgi:hypothetical protein